MKKFKIKSVDDYNYILEENDNTYDLNLEFYDIENLPKENDYIYMSEKLLDKHYDEYDTQYCFGALDSEYGRLVHEETQEEVVMLVIDNKKIYLKRLFG